MRGRGGFRGRGGGGGGSAYRGRGGRGGGWRGRGRGGWATHNNGGDHGGGGAPGGAPGGSVPSQGLRGSSDDLQRLLESMEGAPWGQYHALIGAWQFPTFALTILRVQGDPFAPPSDAFITVHNPQWPEPLINSGPRRIAFMDSLLRRFRAHLVSESIRVVTPSQNVLIRSALDIVESGDLILCFKVQLPGAGRRISGHRAAEVLIHELTGAVRGSLLAENAPIDDIEADVNIVDDWYSVQAQLKERGLIAFVADGSILPRLAGDSDLPMHGSENPVAFQAPPDLVVKIQTPWSGVVSGMGIPRGVTVVTGGAFHGKSTLVDALSAGISPKIRGDGRELVVTDSCALALRAEPGRSVSNVDISCFLGQLPGGKASNAFTTTSASGATSQATGLIEGLEAGASAFLLDEDTCASNFMARDQRMRSLLPNHLEPLTPLVGAVQALHRDLGVSTIVVVGACGSWLDVADVVLAMKWYQCHNITSEAAALAAQIPDPTSDQPRGPIKRLSRGVVGSTLMAAAGGSSKYWDRSGKDTLTHRLGDVTVDTSSLSQLFEPGQLGAIGAAFQRWIVPSRGAHSSVSSILESPLVDACNSNNMSRLALSGYDGTLVAPRLLEVLAVLNRARGVQFQRL